MATFPAWLVLIPLGAFVLVGAFAWAVNRRKLAIAANERDVQLALLSKFTNVVEMTRFLGSPEGRRLTDRLAKQKQADPRRQLVELLQGGGMTLVAGLVFMFVAQGFQVLAIPGVICVAVGFSLLLAACLGYPLMKLLERVPVAGQP